jgi:hypothetical protein
MARTAREARSSQAAGEGLLGFPGVRGFDVASNGALGRVEMADDGSKPASHPLCAAIIRRQMLNRRQRGLDDVPGPAGCPFIGKGLFEFQGDQQRLPAQNGKVLGLRNCLDFPFRAFGG